MGSFSIYSEVIGALSTNPLDTGIDRIRRRTTTRVFRGDEKIGTRQSALSYSCAYILFGTVVCAQSSDGEPTLSGTLHEHWAVSMCEKPTSIACSTYDVTSYDTTKGDVGIATSMEA